MAETRDQPVIIRKFRKGGGKAHGGSWKVAYADFVTAMMAFFLLLWLLSMTSQQKKIALSDYFQNYSIFEKGGGAAVATQQDVPGEGMFDAGKGKKPAPPRPSSPTSWPTRSTDVSTTSSGHTVIGCSSSTTTAISGSRSWTHWAPRSSISGAPISATAAGFSCRVSSLR